MQIRLKKCLESLRGLSGRQKRLNVPLNGTPSLHLLLFGQGSLEKKEKEKQCWNQFAPTVQSFLVDFLFPLSLLFPPSVKKKIKKFAH